MLLPLVYSHISNVFQCDATRPCQLCVRAGVACYARHDAEPGGYALSVQRSIFASSDVMCSSSTSDVPPQTAQVQGYQDLQTSVDQYQGKHDNELRGQKAHLLESTIFDLSQLVKLIEHLHSSNLSNSINPDVIKECEDPTVKRRYFSTPRKYWE